MPSSMTENVGVRIIGDFTDDAINDIAAQEKLMKLYARTKRRTPSQTRVERRRSRKPAERRKLAHESRS